jgi:hypothetical protein
LAEQGPLIRRGSRSRRARLDVAGWVNSGLTARHSVAILF